MITGDVFGSRNVSELEFDYWNYVIEGEKLAPCFSWPCLCRQGLGVALVVKARLLDMAKGLVLMARPSPMARSSSQKGSRVRSCFLSQLTHDHC
ncbi:hypothetical protein L1987_68261 [Smallanthus sonchifolius]|uniref:Uncharacterized protein n=1 Tax=Smallanthus sonchifolius TaxID=185202 RepID=A0ACB9B4X4_9ASTR|nr:hypothetical protein L1987_68261 [Smallanthus sonchifolius]